MSTEENGLLVEITHNYRTYLVSKSKLEGIDALKMLDGTFLDLRKTGIEYDSIHAPTRCRLIGANLEYEKEGRLPTLNVVELQKISPYRPD